MSAVGSLCQKKYESSLKYSVVLYSICTAFFVLAKTQKTKIQAVESAVATTGWVFMWNDSGCFYMYSLIALGLNNM